MKFFAFHSLLRVSFTFLLGFLIAGSSAQVDGISYTLAPRAAYLFPDAQAGMSNTLAIGGDFGLGFGQYVELRANYLQALKATTDFSEYGFNSARLSELTERDLTFSRFGGDVKLNLSRGKFLPYLSLGAGVQSIGLEDKVVDKNIYATAGLGFVLSAADRYTFFAEGRYTGYNYNAARGLLTASDVALLDTDPTMFESKQLNNYSVEAGLAFYMGGRRRGDLSEIDKAYAQQFSNGFRGASFQLTPMVAKTNFDELLPYRDAWFGGASLGLDFGPLVGFSAYYLKAMEDNKLNLDFEDLSMYGGDFRFNLNNVSTGLSPYLSLGGGYIDAKSEYRGVDSLRSVSSQGFASGGGGIILGLSKNVKLRVGAKALLTSASVVEDLQTSDQIRTSVQYTLGFNVALGRKAINPEDLIAMQKQEALNAQQKINDDRAAAIKADYEGRLTTIEAQLNEAYATNDTLRSQELIEKKSATEKVIAELESRDEKSAVAPVGPASSVTTSRFSAEHEITQVTTQNAGGYIRMSATEFESLIEEILISSTPMPQYYPVQMTPQGMPYQATPAPGAAPEESLRDITYPILEELKAMRQDLGSIRTRIDVLEDLSVAGDSEGLSTENVTIVDQVAPSEIDASEKEASEAVILSANPEAQVAEEKLSKEARKAARKAEKAAKKEANRALKDRTVNPE